MSGRVRDRSERMRRRRFQPPREPLAAAESAQRALRKAYDERGLAFLAAAEAGWQMREIAAAVGLAVGTVHAAIKRIEGEGW